MLLVEQPDNQTQPAADVESVSEMSEWERRLEEAGKLDESSSDSKPEEGEGRCAKTKKDCLGVRKVDTN